jgi:hypothetical protein
MKEDFVLCSKIINLLMLNQRLKGGLKCLIITFLGKTF